MDTVDFVLLGLWALQAGAFVAFRKEMKNAVDAWRTTEKANSAVINSCVGLADKTDRELAQLRSDVGLRFSQAWDNMTKLDNKIAWMGDDVNSLEEKLKRKKPTAKPAKKKAVKK